MSAAACWADISQEVWEAEPHLENEGADDGMAYSFAGTSQETASPFAARLFCPEGGGRNLEEERIHVEIPLSVTLETSLCRRGRRRFREIQATSTARIRFDRAHTVLKVSGTAEEIWDVRRKLESFGGVRQVVPTAVWCELMRTRLEADPAKSALERIQTLCGCRVHIERSRQEVRFFGSEENCQRGLELVESFSASCSEGYVPLPATAVGQNPLLPDAVAKAVAEEFEVTVNMEQRRVVVYGLTAAVAEAVTAVERYLETGLLHKTGAIVSSSSSREDAETNCDEMASDAGTMFSSNSSNFANCCEIAA
mmetsp:Transcript_34908/g.81661  ORF Transcript_34908/g.81661 Transcript_34908/m.81661 type:complete len:310 (-) Transcript_34908:487-1416(-)